MGYLKVKVKAYAKVYFVMYIKCIIIVLMVLYYWFSIQLCTRNSAGCRHGQTRPWPRAPRDKGPQRVFFKNIFKFITCDCRNFKNFVIHVIKSDFFKSKAPFLLLA